MNTIASLTLRLGLAFWLCRLPCQGGNALDTWHPRIQPSPAAGLNAVTFGNGLFVAVGDGVLTSPDGIEWTRQRSVPAARLRAVTYGNATFVAVGLGANGYSEGVVAVSADGVGWTNTQTASLPDLHAVTWGKDLFVAVGIDSSTQASAIVTSTDANNWTRVNLPESITDSGPITCVAFGNDIFVAGTYTVGAILVSTNGHLWARAASPGSFHRGIAYGNGTWAVAGGPQIFVGGGGIWTSVDLTNWTLKYVPGGGPNYYPAVAFGNGTFCVPGNLGNISYSRNATDWVLRDAGGQQAPLSGIAYGNGTFVAVGPGGAILQSDDVRVSRLNATEYSETGFRFTVSGEVGRAFRLQASSEVPATNWIDLLDCTNSAGVTNLEDTTARSFDRRFYRVVSP